MKCPLCESESFNDLDYLRDKQYWIAQNIIDVRNPHIGFRQCTDCGHVYYENRPDLEEHYRSHYRKFVQPGNIITTNRKIQWHETNLAPYLYPGAKILDIGCAHGGAIAHLRDKYRCTVKGYELTDGFVNYGRNVYGLDIEQSAEIGDEPKEHYDVVMLYHVLEHLTDPVGTLKKIREILKPDGILYCSVPVWFGDLDEPGGTLTTDFENLYHLNHIQVFSRGRFLYCLTKSGFFWEGLDDQTYGLTVIAKKSDDIKFEKPVYSDRRPTLEAHKEAIKFLASNNPEQALEKCKDYPDAWIALSQKFHKDFHKQKEILTQGLAFCDTEFKLLQHLAMLHMVWDGDRDDAYSNNIKIAEDYFEQCLAIKPNNEQCLQFIGVIEARYKKNYAKAVAYWRKLAEVNPARWAEAHEWIGSYGGQKWD